MHPDFLLLNYSIEFLENSRQPWPIEILENTELS